MPGHRTMLNGYDDFIKCKAYSYGQMTDID
jgi:hypothetical protein